MEERKLYKEHTDYLCNSSVSLKLFKDKCFKKYNESACQIKGVIFMCS